MWYSLIQRLYSMHERHLEIFSLCSSDYTHISLLIYDPTSLLTGVEKLTHKTCTRVTHGSEWGQQKTLKLAEPPRVENPVH